MSVPKLSSVLLQILLEFVSCFAEVVGDVVVADQFTLSAVVDVVGVLIFVQDELEQICPFAEGTDEDMAISCDLHAYHLRCLTCKCRASDAHIERVCLRRFGRLTLLLYIC